LKVLTAPFELAHYRASPVKLLTNDMMISVGQKLRR